jgi:type II secretory pathway component GspD/PulD (secretin)
MTAQTMKHLIYIALLLLGSVIAAAAVAEETIEVIQLHNRTSDDIIPVLQPLVKAGGSLSGSGYKLVIKSTPDNIAEIRQLVADLDGALKQLLITVATSAQIDNMLSSSRAQVVVENGDAGATIGTTGSGPAAGATVQVDSDKLHVDANILHTQTHQDSPVTQQMRVVEGTWGSIQMGQAIPIRSRQRNPDGTVSVTITYRNVTSGFQVLPRVNQDQVTLQIRPNRENVSPQGGGVIDVQSMETTINGKVGEWLSLGGSTRTTTSDSSGIGYSTKTRSAQQDQLWVKVEVLGQ